MSTRVSGGGGSKTPRRESPKRTLSTPRNPTGVPSAVGGRQGRVSSCSGTASRRPGSEAANDSFNSGSNGGSSGSGQPLARGPQSSRRTNAPASAVGSSAAAARPAMMAAADGAFSSRVGLSPRGADGRLRVIVRLRPPVTPAEASRDEPAKLLHDEQSAQVSMAADDAAEGSPTMHRCTADVVCGPGTSQKQMYEHVRSSVLTALSGGRGGVLCYGASGAGKSYSLLRTHIGEWGIAPRAVQEICSGVEQRGRRDPDGPSVEMACLLLHEEKVCDLLHETGGASAVPGAPAGGGGGGGADGGDANATVHAAGAAPLSGTSSPVPSAAAGLPSSPLALATWLAARSAREGLLLLQRCHQGRAAAMGRLGAAPAAVHTIVLVRTPPRPRTATPPPLSPPENREARSPSAAEGEGSAADEAPAEGDAEGEGGGARSGGGLLCLVELAGTSGAETDALTVRAALPDPSLDGLQRLLSSLATNASATSADGAPAAPFFTAVLPTLLHEARLLQRGADTSFVSCLAPGQAASSLSLATLRTTIVATRARLAPPEPSSARGLASLVAQLRRQLAHSAAAAAASAALQSAERERLERENATLSSQLRTQLAHEATWRDELAEAHRRAEAAEAALDAARSSGQGDGAETVQAEFAREARVLGLLCRQDGRHEQALRLQQRARKLHERALGKTHKEVGRDLAHIGNCLCDLGRLDDAATAYRDAHSIDVVALGAEHLHTATDTASLGLVLVTQRKWREALPHLEAAQGLLATQLEASHPNLLAVGKFVSECHERLAAEGAAGSLEPARV